MTFKCMASGCANDAKWQVTWTAMPEGAGIAILQPIKIHCGLIVCDEHKSAVRMEDLCKPADRVKINNNLRMAKKKPIDFSTAKPEFIAIMGDQLPIAAPKNPAALRVA